MPARLRRPRQLVLLTLLLSVWLGGCADKPKPVQPMQLDAVYRLLFNDTLVGNALFALSINADGTYRIEAFTTPAGEMVTQGGHEILEISRLQVPGSDASRLPYPGKEGFKHRWRADRRHRCTDHDVPSLGHRVVCPGHLKS